MSSARVRFESESEQFGMLNIDHFWRVERTVMLFAHRSPNTLFYKTLRATAIAVAQLEVPRMDSSGNSIAELRVELADWTMRARQMVTGPTVSNRVYGA